MLVSRADDPSNGFFFQSLSCSRDCSFSKYCSYCSFKVTAKEIRQSIKPDIYQSAGNRTTIQNIANSSILAVTEIWMLRKEVRCLCSQIAQSVLSNEIDKHGTHLGDDVVGDEIMPAICFMDGPITTALQDGRASEALELWHLHSKHISQVNKNGGKG